MEKGTPKYIPTIGLEVHAQLNTKSKIFAPDATDFGQEPNTQISVVSLAHPGTLPKLNRAVVEKAMRMGLACGSLISPVQIFDRKNYFYPDLPKGYQITQDNTPICVGGEVPIRTEAGERGVLLNRIHLEEDAGKSIHTEDATDTLVDYNRAGVPLIEIVTEPVIDTAEEAAAFVGQIRRLVRYLDVSDGNMEEGSLRCDANISIRPVGQEALGPKVEVKNMNSLRHVAKAITHEIARQIEMAEAGEVVASETRTYDPGSGKTYAMRSKEQLNDYQYFPDPDLSPLVIGKDWKEAVRASLPALPWELESRLQAEYGLPALDAGVLTETKAMADCFLAVCAQEAPPKAVSNWLMGPVKGYLNDQGIAMEEFPLSAEQLAGLIGLVEGRKLSFSVAAQQLFPALLESPKEAVEALAERLNLLQTQDADALEPVVMEVLEGLPDKVMAYRKGKKGLIGMFMGEVMRRTSGKADPQQTKKLLEEKLNA